MTEECIAEKCIFVDRPKECGVCLSSLKLHCVVNKIHLLLTEQGKQDTRLALERNINSPERYKTKAGERQRKH